MKALLAKLECSPALVRVVPFVIFLGLTFFQGKWGAESRYWFYAAKTLVGAWLVWWMWPRVEEMRWKWSGPAVVVGILVFIMWAGLDDFLRWLGINPAFAKWGSADKPWNPHTAFGADSAMAWSFVSIRWL